MIIEFVGSTGAGKTTLASEVQRRLADKVRAATSFDFMMGLLGWCHVTHPTIWNLIQDLIGLPFFIRSLYKHRAFVVFAAKTLARHAAYSLYTVNYLRSIVRRIGMHEMIKRHKRDRIILVDEGTVLSAHLLFVYTNTFCSKKDIENFARLVPLPDLAVYVKTPVDTLARRALQRTDAPREMRSKNQKRVEEYVSRAAQIFDQLAETKEIRDRVLIVANPESTHEERGVVADRIVEFILNHKPGVELIPEVPAGRFEPASVYGEIHAS